MSKESEDLDKEAAQARQPRTAQRVGDILLNNALIIIMVIAVDLHRHHRTKTSSSPHPIINISGPDLRPICRWRLGIGGCIVLTGTDLSAGRVVGLTACISASLLQAVADLASKMWPQIGTLPIRCCWCWHCHGHRRGHRLPSTASSWQNSSCIPSSSRWAPS